MKTMMTTEEMNKSSESPPPASFSSLPYDIVLNVLARISRFHHPTLSLVSKSFRSLLVSPELDTTRTLIGKTENFVHLCLGFDGKDPCWFRFAPIPKQKLISIPWFSYQYPDHPAVVSTGSEIYVIGGVVNRTESRKVFLLDCRSHQWRILPEMRIPRVNPAAGFIDEKLYVFGGASKLCMGENWGEIYDPKTQTWELLPPNTLTPEVCSFVCGTFGRLFFPHKFCFLGKENILFRSTCRKKIPIEWCDLEENSIWREVKGLKGRLNSHVFTSLENRNGGRRLTVWWVSYEKYENLRLVGKINIWCAEISFERPSREELCGTVEWSKILYTFDRSEISGFVSLLCAATVTF